MRKYIKKSVLLLLCSISVVMFNRCKLDYGLSDSITSEQILNSKTGLEQICNGNLALMKSPMRFQGQDDGGNNLYIRQYFYSSEFASDNVVCANVTPDPLFLSFSYDHNPTQPDMSFFWWVSYKMIASVNTVTSMFESNKISDLTESRKHMIGENYFIRAFSYFGLLNFYSTQYAIDSNAPGVPLRITNLEGQSIPRASVKDCYSQIIKDLLTAEALMKDADGKDNAPERGVAYPSLGAVYAFLSRIYLYMEDNDNAILYANKVIALNTYSIDNDFSTYYPNASKGRAETIWCLKFNTTDVIGATHGAISSMYTNAGGGWGEEFASDPLRQLYKDRPWDTRGSYIDTSFTNETNHTGIILYSGIRTVYVTKFSFQDNIATLTSPVFFRISEVYLNRAEAYAKKGDNTNALNDLDLINQNRGYSSSNLYNGSIPGGSTALEEVLLTRRLELAFEGHRKIDLLRNKIDLNRQYWGYHIPTLTRDIIDYNTLPAVDNSTLIPYSDPRNLFYIPQQEVELNSSCVQNP